MRLSSKTSAALSRYFWRVWGPQEGVYPRFEYPDNSNNKSGCQFDRLCMMDHPEVSMVSWIHSLVFEPIIAFVTH